MSKSKRTNPHGINGSDAAAIDKVMGAVNEIRAEEAVNLLTLNAAIARACVKLLPEAVRLATEPRNAKNKTGPDTRMLRLIVRYASTASRRIPWQGKRPEKE